MQKPSERCTLLEWNGKRHRRKGKILYMCIKPKCQPNRTNDHTMTAGSPVVETRNGSFPIPWSALLASCGLLLKLARSNEARRSFNQPAKSIIHTLRGRSSTQRGSRLSHRATGSTGATAFCCSSTGDAGRRDEGPLNGGQGDKVRVCLEIEPFPLILDGEVGAAAGDLATGLGLSPALTLLAGLVHHLVSSHSLLSVVFCIYSSSPSSG